MLSLETYAYTRKKKEDESVYFQSPFVSRTGPDSFLALLRCITTSIRDPFIPVWKRLELFVLFQLIHACIGVAPFPGPFLHIESAAALSKSAAAYIN